MNVLETLRVAPPMNWTILCYAAGAGLAFMVAAFLAIVLVASAWNAAERKVTEWWRNR